jgi:hypothetical protein
MGRRGARSLSLVVCTAAFWVFAARRAEACPAGTPQISTDKPEYATPPAPHVVLTGTGFPCAANVWVRLTFAGAPPSYSGFGTYVTDGAGRFTATLTDSQGRIGSIAVSVILGSRPASPLPKPGQTVLASTSYFVVTPFRALAGTIGFRVVSDTTIELRHAVALTRDMLPAGSGPDGRPVAGDVLSPFFAGNLASRSQAWIDWADGEINGFKYRVTAADIHNNTVWAEAVGSSSLGPITHTYSYVAPRDPWATLAYRARQTHEPHSAFRLGLGLQVYPDATTRNHAPVAGSVPVVTLARGGVQSWSIAGSDANDDPLRWRILDGPAGLEIDPNDGRATWDTGGAAPGLYWSQVVVEEAKPAASLAAAQIGYLLEVVEPVPGNRAPAFAAPTPAGGAVLEAAPGVEIRFEVLASDDDGGDAVRLMFGGVPFGASVDTPAPAASISTSFAWTPQASQLGDHIVSFQAKDNRGGAAPPRSVVIRVGEVARSNTPPAFRSPAEDPGSSIQSVDFSVWQPGFTGVPLVIDVVADDADAQDSVSLGASGLPAGASFDFGAAANPARARFRWTPPKGLPTRTVTFSFSAQDSQGTAARPLRVVVPVLPSTPEFLDPTPADGSIFRTRTGQTLAFTIAAREPDTDESVTLEVFGVSAADFETPAPGFSFSPPAPANSVTAPFSWTPPVGSGTQTYQFELRAATNGGPYAHRIVWVEVDDAPPADPTPPRITPNVTGVLGQNGWHTSDVQLTWSVADDESPVSSTEGCSAAEVRSDTSGATFSCAATSAGGTASTSVTIRRDATPPQVVAAASVGADPYAVGTWTNRDVRVEYACSDATSGLAAPCPAAQLITSEGDGQSAFSGSVCDNAGNCASASLGPIRIDKTPPAVTCHATPSLLWPPNHKLVEVRISVAVSDALSGPNGFRLDSAHSSEPDAGSGDTPDDIQGFSVGTPDVQGLLRAERSGTGNGRLYSLTYSGRDAAGNTALCAPAQVAVPHDRGKP